MSDSATPWIAARQASLYITNSWSLLNSCPLSRWCHPTISSSVVPFSSDSIFSSIRVFLTLLWEVPGLPKLGYSSLSWAKNKSQSPWGTCSPTVTAISGKHCVALSLTSFAKKKMFLSTKSSKSKRQLMRSYGPNTCIRAVWYILFRRETRLKG